MKQETVKRTLSGISVIRKQYQFSCAFGENVDIEEEVREAQKECGAPSPLHVSCVRNSLSAVVKGTIYDEESNKKLVECVRSFLLTHGWTHSDEEYVSRQ